LALVFVYSTVCLALSDITNAQYKGQILLANTSTATTNNAVPFTLSTANMITAGMLNATATDAAVRSGATDVAFMPGWGANPWMVFVPSLGANGSQYDTLYSKGVTGGYTRYFPAAAGMTSVDSATLELGNNFQLEDKGFINTTAGADKYLRRKSSAFGVKVSGASEVTACIWPDIYQTATNGIDALCSDVNPPYKQRVGQRIEDFVGTIESVQVKLQKVLTPTGTGYLRVRKVSDDSVIGTLGTVDVSTLGGFAFVTFNATPVVVTPEQDIRISFEYAGGDSTNFVQIAKQTSEVSVGQYTTYAAAAWADSGAGTDLTILTTASHGFGKRVTATGVTATEHVWKVTADGVNLKIYIDNVEQATVALGGETVPDNANDWYYVENYSMPYMEYSKTTVSGVLQQHIIWLYAATFDDQSAGNHDATPTFRTTTTDADVTATLQSLGPAVTQTPPAGATAGAWELIPAAPAAPGSLYTELGMTFWGAGICQDFATFTSTPLAIPVFFYAFGAAILLGLLCYRLSMGNKRNGQYSRKGSLFIQSTVSGLVLWYFVANGGGVIPGWCLIPFGVLAVACMIWEKSPYPWS